MGTEAGLLESNVLNVETHAAAALLEAEGKGKQYKYKMREGNIFRGSEMSTHDHKVQRITTRLKATEGQNGRNGMRTREPIHEK